MVPNFLKKIFGDIDALSVYNFLKDLLSDFRRAGGNTTPETKKAGGLTSLTDEQDYATLLLEIQEEENRTTPGQGDRIVEALDGFYRFLFPQGGIVAWVYEWIFGTRYRMFLTTLPVIPGKPGVSAKSATRRTPAIPAVPSVPAKDTRKIFVRWMADVILSETDRDAGYQKLLAVLKNRQAPTGIQLPAGWSKGFGALVSQAWTTAQKWARAGTQTVADLTEPANIQAVEVAVLDRITAVRRGTFRVLGVVAIIVALLIAAATYVNFTGGGSL